MKASQLIEVLQSIIKQHGDLDLIYSKDDEGNAFYEVQNNAVECIFDAYTNEAIFDNPETSNAICIN